MGSINKKMKELKMLWLWLVPSLLVFVCLWNNQQLSLKMEDIESAIQKQFVEFECELRAAQTEAQKAVPLVEKVERLRKDLDTMAGHLERLLEDPDLRSREVSKAALDYLMRRHL